jgi:tRNA(fMet)-specific endonuclease VapC
MEDELRPEYTYIDRARHVSDVVRGYEMLAKVLRDFVAAPVMSFDAAAAAAFDRLLAQRVRVATMDLRIASIALSRQMVLVTRNVSDFRKVPSLQVEDWTV